MSRKPLRKMRACVVACWMVLEYRPHRTRKGHFVWRKCRKVAGPLSPDQLKAQGYGGLPTEALHNVRLTADEELKALTEEGEAHDANAC